MTVNVLRNMDHGIALRLARSIVGADDAMGRAQLELVSMKDVTDGDVLKAGIIRARRLLQDDPVPEHELRRAADTLVDHSTQTTPDMYLGSAALRSASRHAKDASDTLLSASGSVGPERLELIAAAKTQLGDARTGVATLRESSDAFIEQAEADDALVMKVLGGGAVVTAGLGAAAVALN